MAVKWLVPSKNQILVNNKQGDLVDMGPSSLHHLCRSYYIGRLHVWIGPNSLTWALDNQCMWQCRVFDFFHRLLKRFGSLICCRPQVKYKNDAPRSVESARKVKFLTFVVTYQWSSSWKVGSIDFPSSTLESFVSRMTAPTVSVLI